MSPAEPTIADMLAEIETRATGAATETPAARRAGVRVIGADSLRLLAALRAVLALSGEHGPLAEARAAVAVLSALKGPR